MAQRHFPDRAQRRGHQFYFCAADDGDDEPVAAAGKLAAPPAFTISCSTSAAASASRSSPRMIARGAQAHQALMVGHLTPADPAFMRQLHGHRPCSPGTADPVTAAGQAYAAHLRRTQPAGAFVGVCGHVPGTFGLMVLCCLPLIFLFKRVQHAKKTEVVAH